MNTFHLRNYQKYLKVEILRYVFLQYVLFEFLHDLSAQERKFLIKEYKMIKQNEDFFDFYSEIIKKKQVYFWLRMQLPFNPRNI